MTIQRQGAGWERGGLTFFWEEKMGYPDMYKKKEETDLFPRVTQRRKKSYKLKEKGRNASSLPFGGEGEKEKDGQGEGGSTTISGKEKGGGGRGLSKKKGQERVFFFCPMAR